MKRIFVQIWVLLTPLALYACVAPASEGGALRFGLSTASDAMVQSVARRALQAIQRQSIRENVEYCGYIMERPSGSLYFTEPKAGGMDWCEFADPNHSANYEEGDFVVADYHTHAGYDANSDSEVPSLTDLHGNGDAGVPGFVSTPGGRFWYVAADGRSTYQICGVGCLLSDPDFVPETGAYLVLERYTLRALNRRGY